MPAAVLNDMETSDVSIFAVQVQPNELHSRMQMTDVVNRRHMRHAHMVNITAQIMCQGMRADYALVDRLSQKVLDECRRAKRIRATTPRARHHRRAESRLQVVQDLADHLAAKVGQPARRRVLYFARRGQRRLRRRRRGRRLSLRALRPAAHHSAVDRDRGNRIVRVPATTRSSCGLPRLHPDRRELRPRRRVRHRHQHRRDARHRQHPAGREAPRLHIAFGHPYGEHTGAPWK